MKTPQEILAEWADPETGGTMPKEVREAALSVLKALDEAELQIKYEQERNRLNVQQNEARVKELEAALKRIDAIACEHGRGAIGEAQGVARAALKPKP